LLLQSGRNVTSSCRTRQLFPTSQDGSCSPSMSPPTSGDLPAVAARGVAVSSARHIFRKKQSRAPAGRPL
jgi:hypothetical protein